MKNFKSVKIRIPASITNAGPGFDSIGIAVSLYNIVEFIETNSRNVEITVKSSESVPSDRNNLLYKAASYVFSQCGYDSPGMKIICDQGIPLKKGLGSSAAAIVAGLLCGNAFSEAEYSETELLEMAYELDSENHNSFASWFGGICISSISDFTHVNFPVDRDLDVKIVIILPEMEYSKENVRVLFPAQYSKQAVSTNLAKSAQFVAGFFHKRPEIIASAMKEEQLIAPYIKFLIPGYTDIILASRVCGAYGVSVCGNGPALAVFCPSVSAESIGSRIIRIFEKFRIRSEYIVCDIDNYGTRIID